VGKYNSTIEFIKEMYGNMSFIPLHEPRFVGNEKKYINECIDSTFVSSVGKFVDEFEKKIADFTGAGYAVATVNGTSALHISLLLAGVEDNDEVITQPLTFIATCNAIHYTGAKPVFIDVDRETMGLSAEKLEDFLDKNTEIIDGECINKHSKRRIKAVVPMHTFGFASDIKELLAIAQKHQLALVEDAAESLGSYYEGQHTGTYGLVSAFSFNGNKIITTGGGGMIVTNDEKLAKKAKHITTTAKVPHPYEYDHDMVGFNYRLPNLNSALGCAQLEMLPAYLKRKRAVAENYAEHFKREGLKFCSERPHCKANYWLNTLVLDSLEERNAFLKETNENGVMTRPIWKLMNKTKMFREAQCANLENAEWLESRVVNIPSSVVW
jgi:perosamine synthetase